MKKLYIILAVLLLSSTACSSTVPVPEDLAWESFQDDDFQVDLPTWEPSEPPDAEAIFAISQGAATFWIKRWPFIPRIVAENVGIWAEDEHGSFHH